jgi:glycosyltransferase involved in cell wall biosynthesis
MKIALTHTRSPSGTELNGYVRELGGRLSDAGHDVHVFCRSDTRTKHDPRLTLHRIPGRLGRLGASDETWLSRKISGAGYDVVHSFEGSSSQDVHTVAGRVESQHALTDVDFTTLMPVVDTERFKPGNSETHRDPWRERVVISRGAFVVLCDGDGFAQLGAEALLEAARLVEERGGLPGGRRLRVAFIGYETQQVEQELSTLAKDKGVWDTVKFYGSQASPEHWHAMADLFVQPEADVPVGDGALRAMATGLPVLLAADSAVAGVIRSGENGVLLDKGLGASLASAVADRIVEFAKDSELGTRIGAAARETAEQQSWKRHVERLTALYEKVAILRQAAG